MQAELSTPVGNKVTSSPAPSAGGGHGLRLEQITHRFGETVAVRQVDLQVNPGELIALLGPSGCGKTTILKLIAGFLRPSQGQIWIDMTRVDQIPPHHRGVGIVFQNYALFPHMTVWDNIAYGLQTKKLSPAEIRSKVTEMLELVQLPQMANRYPHHLSGGQQQRIALARALAVEPRLLLLDEPFSALDKNLRLDMQIEVKRLISKRGITTLFVTHDQEEALSMADRIAVINQGSIEQFDPPSAIYDRPRSLFVSTFVGTTNLLVGTVVQVYSDGCLVQLKGVGQVRTALIPPVVVGESVLLAVRPENFLIQMQPMSNGLEAMVEVCLPLGSATIYQTRTQTGETIKVTQPRVLGAPLLTPGHQVYLQLASPTACSLFPNTYE